MFPKCKLQQLFTWMYLNGKWECIFLFKQKGGCIDRTFLDNYLFKVSFTFSSPIKCLSLDHLITYIYLSLGRFKFLSKVKALDRFGGNSFFRGSLNQFCCLRIADVYLQNMSANSLVSLYF